MSYCGQNTSDDEGNVIVCMLSQNHSGPCQYTKMDLVKQNIVSQLELMGSVLGPP